LKGKYINLFILFFKKLLIFYSIINYYHYHYYYYYYYYYYYFIHKKKALTENVQPEQIFFVVPNYDKNIRQWFDNRPLEKKVNIYMLKFLIIFF